MYVMSLVFKWVGDSYNMFENHYNESDTLGWEVKIDAFIFGENLLFLFNLKS